MSDIFISYAREDRDEAKTLAELFQQQDWSVWWDRSIPPGRSFDEVIEEALGAAKCVVVLWSKNSASSDWVKSEAAEGLHRKILVPVRIDSANVPLEFRRLQTVDLSDWKGDAGHLELGGILEAVAANIKGVVQRPPNEGKRRKPIKPVLTVLAIVTLLAAGFAFYKFAGGGARLGSRASPSAIPENASPAGEELMRTPELGLEFWQRDQKSLMFATQAEKPITRVFLKRAPFEIRCPHFEGAAQICAWSDASIFDAIVAAKRIEDIPYFSPGTGRADTEFGSASLGLSNLSHHHFVPERRRAISSQQDSIFFSSLMNVEDGKKLTDWPTVYLVVFVNLNQTDEIDSHEYECLILDFGK
ncbi:MAG: toll/interleukin-1 receptor domain-containing protein [Verrucomicrobia bacterium]|nr:MAG: toll/interleukin-1 receptor domain-containing protein [Verrucomicrobiota bacterium]